MYNNVCTLVAQSSLTLCDPIDHSPPDSSVHRILQARTLEWGAIPFSRASSPPRDWTQVSCTAGRFFIVWATRGAPYLLIIIENLENIDRNLKKGNITISPSSQRQLLLIFSFFFFLLDFSIHISHHWDSTVYLILWALFFSKLFFSL